MSMDASSEVDVLIVGSGPVGATFGRILSDRMPHCRISMVDLGPQLSERAGAHVRNIADPAQRTAAQVLSQGPTRYRYDNPSLVERKVAGNHMVRTATLARPGTHLVGTPLADGEDLPMPAAAASSNVGGMRSHWTCACPRPRDSERIPFFDDAEFTRIYLKAEELLQVSTSVYPQSQLGSAIEDRLNAAFAATLSPSVGRMPLACQPSPDGKLYWTGPESILGDLADAKTAAKRNFTLLSDTLCRRVTVEGSRATGALVEHLPSGRRTAIAARVIILAADALRTPQILWASGVRPQALGHYLNDQPQLLCAVTFDVALDEAMSASRAEIESSSQAARPQMDAVVGVFWVPFKDRLHPFHGQVMHFDLSPVAMSPDGSQADADHVVGLGWFCPKDLRFEDCVLFSDGEVDYLGMPQMKICYALTDRDHANIAAAKEEQFRVAAHLGVIREGFEPKLLPAGSSLHYQGTVRMGLSPDDSVCDRDSKVWSVENLFLGGNGVIPTATACNPTLTSCALAVHACEKIIELLSAIA